MPKIESHLASRWTVLDAEAAVLAGGDSRRMGRDKAWLKLGESSIIQNVLSVLDPLFDPVRIIANQPERFAPLRLPVQPDLRPGSGPLGGIHAALTTARRNVVFITACDLPFLSRDLIQGMAEFFDEHDAVVPCVKDGPVPVCAFYSPRCLPAVEACLDRGDLAAMAFLNEVDTRWIESHELHRLDPTGLALTNINTPEDYEKARLICRDQR